MRSRRVCTSRSSALCGLVLAGRSWEAAWPRAPEGEGEQGLEPRGLDQRGLEAPREGEGERIEPEEGERVGDGGRGEVGRGEGGCGEGGRAEAGRREEPSSAGRRGEPRRIAELEEELLPTSSCHMTSYKPSWRRLRGRKVVACIVGVWLEFLSRSSRE